MGRTGNLTSLLPDEDAHPYNDLHHGTNDSSDSDDSHLEDHQVPGLLNHTEAEVAEGPVHMHILDLTMSMSEEKDEDEEDQTEPTPDYPPPASFCLYTIFPIMGPDNTEAQDIAEQQEEQEEQEEQEDDDGSSSLSSSDYRVSSSPTGLTDNDSNDSDYLPESDDGDNSDDSDSTISYEMSI